MLIYEIYFNANITEPIELNWTKFEFTQLFSW